MNAPHFGQPISPANAAAWDISIGPDGVGLPPGSGTPAKGAVVYAQKCAVCHGDKAKAKLTRGSQPRRPSASPRRAGATGFGAGDAHELSPRKCPYFGCCLLSHMLRSCWRPRRRLRALASSDIDGGVLRWRQTARWRSPPRSLPSPPRPRRSKAHRNAALRQV